MVRNMGEITKWSEQNEEHTHTHIYIYYIILCYIISIYIMNNIYIYGMLHYMYIITIGFPGWNAPNGHDNGCKTVLDHGNTGMVKSRGRHPKKRWIFIVTQTPSSRSIHRNIRYSPKNLYRGFHKWGSPFLDGFAGQSQSNSWMRTGGSPMT